MVLLFNIFNIRGLLAFTLLVLLSGTPATAQGEGTASNQSAPASQGDRKSGASKASAMALAQAAMAQVMCLKMMADAQKEGDSDKMAMAAAMCAQAAALAANGKENEEGAKKSSSPPPMGAVPTFEKAKIDTDPKSDSSPSVTSSEISKPSTIQLSQTPTPSLETEKPENTGNIFQEDKSFQNKSMSSPLPETKEVDSSRIALKNGSDNTQGFGNSLGGFGGSESSSGSLNGIYPFSQASSQRNLASEDSKSNSKKPTRPTSSGGAESGSGFDDLMSRYMGGMSSGSGISGGASGGTIDLAYGLQKPGFKPRTIFEFASDQYKHASQQRSLKAKKAEVAPTLFQALSPP